MNGPTPPPIRIRDVLTGIAAGLGLWAVIAVAFWVDNQLGGIP